MTQSGDHDDAKASAHAQGDASTSVPKLDQNIRLFWCMSYQMRRIGIVPTCNLNQPAFLPVLVQRLDYCQAAVIDEERVVAKYLPELRKRRVIVRDNLSVDLLQDRAQLFGT